jgi:hypothetical protein
MQKEGSLSLVQILNEARTSQIKTGDVNTNLELCKKAIKDASNMSFRYMGHTRFVEPFTVGNHIMSGNKVLAAWHVYGFSYSQNKPQWRLYRLDKMSETKLRQVVQRKNRPLYNPNDSRMSKIDSTMADFYTTGESDNFTLEKIKQLVKDKFGINPDNQSFMNKLKTSISKFLNLKK